MGVRGPLTGKAAAGSVRGWRVLRMSRQALVAMVYSQVRRVARPPNVSWCRQARSMVSCTRSSASSKEPRRR